jgi:hypothetical protein
MMKRAFRVSWSILTVLACGILFLTSGCEASGPQQAGTFLRDLLLSVIAAFAL